MNAQRFVAASRLFALLLFACVAPLAAAQTVDPVYAGTYTLTDLGAVPGLPTSYGGLIFKAGDPNTIIIGGGANTAPGLFYSVPVTRGTGGHITALGAATALGYGTFNDGGVAYGPGGVLFYSEYPVNRVGQVKSGSNADDKTVDLGSAPLNIAASTGALNFVPAGYMGAGQFKISSYSGGQFYNVTLAADGSGTYNLTGATLVTTLPGGPEGYIYVPLSSPLFPNQSMLVTEYAAGNVAAYTIDANGNPVLASRQLFISGLTGAEGAAIDPVTGDFLFSTFGSVNHVIEVRGFIAPSADLAIAKSDTPDPVTPGGTIAYTLTVTNNGTGNAQNVALNDVLPAGTTFASLAFNSGVSGTCTQPQPNATGTVNCTYPMLAANQSSVYTLTVNVSVNATGTITNIATVASSTNDPNTNNNSATSVTTVQAVATPKATLTKSFSPTTIASGGTTTLTFTLTNPAPNNPAQTVGFNDTLPPGLQLAANANPQFTCLNVIAAAAPPVLTVTSATVPASTTVPATCTLSVDLTNVPGQTGTCPNANFTNNAASIGAAVNLTNGVTAACVTVTQQTPSLNKAFNPATINAGGTSTLTFTLTNPAPNNPAQVVSFTDTLPSGLAVAAAPNIGGTCAGGTVTAVAGGSSISVAGRTVPASTATTATCTVTVDISNATGQLNASCTGNPAAFTNGSGNIGGLTNLTNAVTPGCLVVNGSSFAISKVASASSLPTGSALSYTIVVTNNGPSAANGALLTDPVIAGFTASGISCTNATNGAACPPAGNVTVANLQAAGIALPTFPANSAITFVLSGTLMQPNGSVNNTATLSAPGILPVTVSASAVVTVLAPGAANIPTMSERALLALMLALAIGGGIYLRRGRR